MQKEKSILKRNNEKSIREDLYHYIRYWLIYYKKKTIYSKNKSNMKQTSTHVQAITNIRWIFIEHKIIIIIIPLF